MELWRVANAEQKLSLGSWNTSLAEPTIWVVFVFGLVTNLQNFGIDQSYVQRYITAKTDRDAVRSVWIGALCYIPLSAVFLLIGTALFAFYRSADHSLPPGIVADAVFPRFIGTQLPVGLRGLVVAAICSAAMDSNLNCCATLFLCDIYRRYWRPAASDAESMWVLRGTIVVMGALSVVCGMAMIGSRLVLDAWWMLASVLSGGILGLFLLGTVSRRTTSRVALASTMLGVGTILWLTAIHLCHNESKLPFVTGSSAWQSFKSGVQLLPAFLRQPIHDNLIIVFGTLAILLSGLIISRRLSHVRALASFAQRVLRKRI